MKLTCVTATFNCVKAGNRERLIRCVESVTKLKTEHEHLIYDGASTDGTAELLRELEAKIPGLKVVSERDTGIYNALNKGVRDAQGEWFYVLGADDYISHPEVMDELLANYDCDEIVTPAETDGNFRHITLNRIFLHTPYCHQGVIQKRNAIRRFGAFDEHYAIAADYALILKFHKACLDIRYTDCCFAYFGGGGASSTLTDRLVGEVTDICARQFALSLQQSRKMHAQDRVSIDVALTYFFHADYAFRYAARIAVRAYIKDWMRIALYPLVILRRKIRDQHLKGKITI